MKHFGTCFCGTAELEVAGTPEVSGYCHCRSWSGGPANAFCLWKPEAVRITEQVLAPKRTEIVRVMTGAGTSHVGSIATSRGSNPT